MRLGPFNLDSIIGTGANGDVWLGRHVDSGMQVAVKVLKAELALNERASSAFRREVHAVAALNHPHIVTIFDTGEIPPHLQAESDGTLAAGSPYLVMEWASGGTLDEQRRPRTWPQLRTTLLTLLDALGHAHANGVVHRDLKPANILFCTDQDLRPGLKLADFGLALVEAPEQEVRRLLGTPHYMAPEQWRSSVRDQGPWTDLYALACMIYRIITGRGPFAASTIQKMRRHHLRSPVPDLKTRFETPSGFQAWLNTCLHKDRHQRFQQAAEAMRALLALDAIAVSELGSPRLSRRDSPEIVGAGLGLYGFRSIPLIDRSGQRESLWAQLKAARRGVRLVTLRGPAGTGKSRLAEWIGRAAHEQGMAGTLLRARHGADVGTADGLGRMIRQELRALGLEDDEAGLRDRAVDWLAGRGEVPTYEVEALVGLASEGVHGTVRFRSPRERYAAVTRIVERLCERGRVLVWLDDVHHGIDTLGWLRHLLERAPDLPVLVVSTIIPDQGSVRANRLLEGIHAEFGDRAEVCEVPPLDDSDRIELVQSLLGMESGLAADVARLTHGNPLFAVQLVGDWVHRELLEPTPEGFRFREDIDAELPEDLQRVWSTRLNNFLGLRPEDDRRALELAAVLGHEVLPNEWDAACERAWAIPTPGLVEELVRMRLARTGERGPGEGWQFVHGMLRDALLESATTSGRLTMHNRLCAETLKHRGRPGDAARIARMLAAGGRVTSSMAWLLKASDHAIEAGDVDRAAAVLEAHDDAMGRLRLGDQDWRRIDGWLARARLAWLRGEDVLEYTQRSVDAARSQRFDDRLARALHLQGRVALEAGDLDQAATCLAEAETLTRGAVNDVGSLAEVLRDQAEVHTQRGDYKGALRLLREARDRFVLADRKDGVAACSRAQSRIMAGQGKLDEARGLLRYAIEQVQEGGDLRASADLNAEAGMLAEQQNKPREALEHFSSALEQLRVVATDRRRLADIEARVHTLSQSLALDEPSLDEPSERSE